MMALINDMKSEKDHPGQPKLVVSNNTKADGLVFAEKNSIETFASDIEKIEDNLIFEETTLQVLREKNIDIVFIGDSATKGECVNQGDEMVSQLRIFQKNMKNLQPRLLSPSLLVKEEQLILRICFV